MITCYGKFWEGLYRLGLTTDPRCNCPLEGLRFRKIVYEYTKSNSIRDRQRERALIEGVAPTAEAQGATRVLRRHGRMTRLRLEEETLQRQ